MYSTKTLTAKAGRDTFAFTNKSSVPHNFTILKGSKVIGATPTFAGGVKLLTVTLAAGTYTFECTVPGHAEAGMKGTLTVT
jgi:plastocyanin